MSDFCFRLTVHQCSCRRTYRLLLCCLSVIFLSGCGGESGPELVAVRGKVTHNGQPVPGLFVTFLPKNGRPSWALTSDTGAFEAHYTNSRDGVLPGLCKVWVSFKPQSFEEEQAIMNGENPYEQWSEMLEKYGSEESTPLIVTASSKQPFIELRLD